MKLENIFGSEHNAKHGIPSIETWNNAGNFHAFTVFSFALTPTGRVSKYWCSNTFRYFPKVYSKERFVDVPSRLEKHVTEWAERERPRLKPGYRWSKVYAY